VLRLRLRQWMRSRIHQHLNNRTRLHAHAAEAIATSAAAAAALRRRTDALSAAIGRLSDDLTLMERPFTAELTIDQAWRRHPAAGATFARHHLPACDGCAVRFDETLAEAAEAYDLDLSVLLADLNALL
jgi:hypothetical protein